MSAFLGYPELFLEQGAVEGLYRIQTRSGRVIFAGHFDDPQDAERLLICWNACRKIFAPAAHLQASDEHCEKVERLRKEAWSLAGSLQAELDQLKASMVPA
jgi:hypothetical protein